MRGRDGANLVHARSPGQNAKRDAGPVYDNDDGAKWHVLKARDALDSLSAKIVRMLRDLAGAPFGSVQKDNHLAFAGGRLNGFLE